MSRLFNRTGAESFYEESSRPCRTDSLKHKRWVKRFMAKKNRRLGKKAIIEQKISGE